MNQTAKILNITGYIFLEALKLATPPPRRPRFKINSSYVLCSCTEISFPFTLFFVPMKKNYGCKTNTKKAPALDGQYIY